MPKRTNVVMPPEDGVSPELLQLALNWLVKRYGSRAVDSSLSFGLKYHLGALEREYASPSKPKDPGEADFFIKTLTHRARPIDVTDPRPLPATSPRRLSGPKNAKLLEDRSGDDDPLFTGH